MPLYHSRSASFSSYKAFRSLTMPPAEASGLFPPPLPLLPLSLLTLSLLLPLSLLMLSLLTLSLLALPLLPPSLLISYPSGTAIQIWSANLGVKERSDDVHMING